MTAKTTPFSLGAVLTITTGRLLCPLHEVATLLTHMTGEEISTHQLPRGMDDCRPWLLDWFPGLGTVALDILDFMILGEGPAAGCQAFLQALRRVGYPATYDVPPLPREEESYVD